MGPASGSLRHRGIGRVPGGVHDRKAYSWLEAAASPEAADADLFIFQAGTRPGADGSTVTAGGRVLGVTALGATIEEARSRAYEAAARIRFEGAYLRRDIAAKAGVG